MTRMVLQLVSVVCVGFLISSVTAVPAVASGPVGAGEREYTDTFTAGLAGKTVGLGFFSNNTVFREGAVRGVAIQLGPAGRGQRGDGSAGKTIRDGIFTITQGERGNRVSRSGLDEQGRLLVEQLQSVGFAFDGAITDPYETTVSFGAIPAIDPAVLAASGLRRSTETTTALVGSGRVTTYTFTNTTTGRLFELTVTQPTDEHGTAAGKAIVSTPSSQLGGKTARSTTDEPYLDAGIAVVVVGGTGAVAGVATTLGLFGGAATVTELTPLLGGTAAVCCGLSATGVGVVVGVAVAVGVGIIVAYWLFTHHGGGDSLAPAVRTTGTSSPYYIALSDGAVVRDDGTVTFYVRDYPKMMPLTGTDWVAATRKSAINRAGELSILTPQKPEGPVWVKERSDRRYIAISQTGSWFAAISTDNTGKTYLEIPTGHDQPSSDSHIREDLALLNAGINQHHHHHLFKVVTIGPPVTEWKAFVPGDDYGLALADDGRVFCVGTSKDNLGDLHGRYTKVTTGVKKGRIENDRYAIGIRMGILFPSG